MVIRVEPVTTEWADALAKDDETLARALGAAVEAGWLGFPETRSFILGYARSERPAEWGPHLIFDIDGSLVGNGGWKGQPVDGVAELGYAVAPARQGRGIATSVVCELVARAAAVGVRTVIAHTLAETSASTTVLERCGFVRTREFVDDEDGLVWRWERALTSAR